MMLFLGFFDFVIRCLDTRPDFLLADDFFEDFAFAPSASMSITA